jgi:uncharacterized repeat protein (TIGR04138 family)
MQGKNFNEIVSLIHKEDPRYAPGAYHFMRHALDYTLQSLGGQGKKPLNRHISGAELSEGIRAFAIAQYGPMSHALLREWGIGRTEDFGEIVFNLVEYGVFGKTDDDSRHDFKNLYDFHSAFVAPFEPAGGRQVRKNGKDSSHPATRS